MNDKRLIADPWLRPVSDSWRRIAAVACTAASVLAFLAAFALAINMLWRRSITSEGKPIWLGVIIVAGLGILCAFMSLRLSRRTSKNQVTLLPALLIQIFGVMGLAECLFFYFYKRSSLLYMIEVVPAALAMILIPKRIARMRRLFDTARNPSQSIDPTTRVKHV
jgi:drug/metabolite transporter (DMT)-like permease